MRDGAVERKVPAVSYSFLPILSQALLPCVLTSATLQPSECVLTPVRDTSLTDLLLCVNFLEIYQASATVFWGGE